MSIRWIADLSRLALTTGVVAAGLGGAGAAGAVEVTGKVVMPEVCAPEISPAVVVLEPIGAKGDGAPAPGGPAEVVLVNQRGLQFVPRVRAVVLGQAVRFSNEDSETHNVHVVSPGNGFNQSMTPGQPRDFTPGKPGVVRLACDIHSHMTGYLIVSRSPWVQACSARGNFRIDGVPDGTYQLTVWHEMGEPLRKQVTIGPSKASSLGTLTLSAPPAPRLAPGQSAPARRWAEVIDRVGVKLAAALAAADRADGFKKARKLAEDAYWVDFEASDFETAVRLHLGFAPAVALERKFRAVVPAVKAVSRGEMSAGRALDEASRPLILALVEAAGALNRKGVTDAAHLDGNARTVAATAQAATATATVPAPSGDPSAWLEELSKGFTRVRALAGAGEADDAASAMSDAYWDGFEPVERFIEAHRPQAVRPLEAQFLAIRGEVSAGLKGEALAGRLDELQTSVRETLDRCLDEPAGAFGPAFAASLVTTVREGAEVILLLAMLIALAVKTGQRGALRAIAWGVGLAVLASAATALGLNLMVASAKGRAREVMEGGVMLAAAGVLFYVSYWLISQSESRRWMAFLKRQASRGVGLDGKPAGALALTATAFLAVYREGAETALMYQALIGSQAGARAGLTGLAMGVGVGLVVLAAVALAVRATSVRLPVRAFFQVTGAVLFAMAVVFAGNGVFELQASGLLKTTPLHWLGGGLPWLGVHPNLQAVSVQALLLAGAALGMVVLAADWDDRAARPTVGAGV